MKSKPKVKLNCESCGNEFFVVPAIANKRKNCSRQCHYLSRSIELPNLSNRQKEIITGSLLGDAHLEKPQKESHNSRFRKGQKKEFLEYQNSLFEELNPYSKTIKTYDKTHSNGVVEHESLVYTHSHSVFTELRNIWYEKEIKIVPKDIVMTPLTLAYWFCDDGYTGGDNNAFLCTQCFTIEEVTMLSEFLLRDLDVKSVPVKSKIGSNGVQQYSLYIGSRNYDYFVNVISDHIVWDCMKHKTIIHKRKHKWYALC